MAFTVETGTGSTTATSYCSVATADSYHAKKAASAAAWDALDTTTKQLRLEEATEIIDRDCIFCGTPAKLIPSEQALQWPRSGMYDRNEIGIASDTIPLELQKATAELAYQMSVENREEEPVRGISKIKADVIEVTFDKSNEPRVLPDTVRKFLVSFLEGIAGGAKIFGKAVR